MKKLIAILLCGMMMVGSLCVFAEEGIMPQDECFHDFDWDEVITGVEETPCGTITYYDVYCTQCGDVIGDREVVKETHAWVDELIDGTITTVCSRCDAIK